MFVARVSRAARCAWAMGICSRGKSTAVITNGAKLNFDNTLNWDKLEALAQVTTFDDTEPNQLPERAVGAEILITKVGRRRHQHAFSAALQTYLRVINTLSTVV